MENKVRRFRKLFLIFMVLAGVSSLVSSYVLDHLSDVFEAAKWLDASAVKTPAGLAWPSDPRDPKTINSSLYAGTPGVVLFYLEAASAARQIGFRSQSEAYIEKVKAGADDLLVHLSKEQGTGLYEGLAGIGFTLEEAFKFTFESRYRNGFLTCLEVIKQKAAKAGKGIAWSPVADIISGGAGTGLFLLYAYKETRNKSWLDLAEEAGARLVELGKPKNGGLDWAMDPGYPRLMPNFSHGTAGIAFFLARLYEETKKKEFLEAAISGAKYLQSIAKTDGDACLIFHDEPGGKDLYYLGWCHGPVGTANLFYSLFKISGEEVWLDWVKKCARGIRDSGVPEKETPGFWNNAGICCGLAGVADFFLSLYKVTGEARDLRFGSRIMARLAEKATTDASGKRWVQAEHRARPELLVAQTGLMQGAAGIGLVSLHWHQHEHGLRPRIVLPDSAFSD